MDYKLEVINKMKDKRGELNVFLKNKELLDELKTFGQIYYVTFQEKGIVRGNHYHKKWREWFGIQSGILEVILEDVKTGEKVEHLLDASDSNYLRLEIGPFIAHSFRSLSDQAILLNYTNVEWEPTDTFEHILMEEMKHDYYLHPEAIVETKDIGKKTTIWANTHILNGAKIGKNVNINDLCFIENDVEIGDNATIKSGVHIWNGVKIENNVQVGPSVAFTNDLYPRAKNKNFKLVKTLLKEGSSIGANCTILGGKTIGKYALIGAGSLVTKDVGDYSLSYGYPAKHVSYICICTNKLKKTYKSGQKIKCKKCKRKYQFKNNVLKLINEN